MAAKNTAKTEENKKETCFVIMPFSDPEGYEPGHFRKIYDHTFAPAIEAAGYEPHRIDDNSVSNLIHGKMLNELVTAPMVLCDLSTNNPNVLYELGIRHAFDKPVVLVQEIGQKRIFDIGAITSVEYHPSRLYEDVLDDQMRIADAIRQTAKAKTKYSIMSLVAMQAAQPATGESVPREDRVEFLLQEMTRKINGLEKQITNNRPRAAASRRQDRNNASREDVSLRELMDEIEDYLRLCKSDYDQAVEDDVLRYHGLLCEKIAECRKTGEEQFLVSDARSLDNRLFELYSNLR